MKERQMPADEAVQESSGDSTADALRCDQFLITVLSKAADVPMSQLRFGYCVSWDLESSFSLPLLALSLACHQAEQTAASASPPRTGGEEQTVKIFLFSCWQPQDSLFCLCVRLEVSLYDYKDQLTAEKRVLWWFYLSVPKWHFIQNINYFAHRFPDKFPLSSFFIEQRKYITWYCMC